MRTKTNKSFCFCVFAGLKMSIMKDTQSAHLSYVPPYTSLHTQVSRNPAAAGSLAWTHVAPAFLSIFRAGIRLSTCGVPRRSRASCWVRRDGTGGITRHWNSTPTLPRITRGPMQTCSTVSATTCRLSADPGPRHTQKMVRRGLYTQNKHLHRYRRA